MPYLKITSTTTTTIIHFWNTIYSEKFVFVLFFLSYGDDSDYNYDDDDDNDDVAWWRWRKVNINEVIEVEMFIRRFLWRTEGGGREKNLFLSAVHKTSDIFFFPKENKWSEGIQKWKEEEEEGWWSGCTYR